ncbi:unnamed protein product [Cladocopium goreaui]|uniref:Uncharacterized protein n=1 Tax=Cladocopium goreaui TaxID=2562237 RepID=A0A9P1CDG4_9DINO|nr:unnamed protein product [Cladocopium goreaui]
MSISIPQGSAARRLVSCLMITLGAGMVEGSLLVNWAHGNAGGFVLRYAIEQLLPSLIWCTQDASLVAEAMGFEPQALLKNLEGREGASTLLAVGQCHAVRSVSAGFNLLGQLFRFTQITNNVLKQFEQKVRLGKDVPLSSGAKERVIRLCGEFSYATYAAISKSGRFHILPVMDPASMPMLTEQLTHGFKYPLFLNVPSKLWGQPDVWEPLLGRAVRPSWLLQGVAGKKVLCVEVDGTERHEILLFGRVRKIGIEQASNAFRAISFVMLGALASQGLPSSRIQLLRVYLGDSHELSTTGNLARFTCRERVESRREADVLVDFHAPILRRLRLWALDNAVPVDVEQGEALPTICFETTCPERFQNLAHLMRDTAQVVDQVQAVKLCKQLNTTIPRLIHYPSTAETVNAAYALARPGELYCDPRHTLVLCERDWGAQEIRKLNVGFKVLSAAEIIDDLLREVRQWARHGFSGREIQTELDRRDATILKLLRRITWLNANVFGYAPLDQETREAAASVPLDRTLEILKDLEGKSSTVQNPSGYVKASIKRELSGDPRKRPASIVTGPPAKRRA